MASTPKTTPAATTPTILVGVCALVLACDSSPSSTSSTASASANPSADRPPAAAAPEPTPTPSPTPAAAPEAAPPHASALARTKELGLAAVDANQKIAGPFDGPEGSLYYAQGDGKVTFYLPDAPAIYFAQVTEKGGMRYDYGVAPHGTFAFDLQGNATALDQPPAVLSTWPHADAVVSNFVAAVKAGRAQQEAASSAAAAQAIASKGLHDTTMRILDNIGSSGCTDYYDGVYYLGCW